MAEMTYCGKVLVRGFIFPRLREEGGRPKGKATLIEQHIKLGKKPRSKLEKSHSKKGIFYLICDYL